MMGGNISDIRNSNNLSFIFQCFMVDYPNIVKLLFGMLEENPE